MAELGQCAYEAADADGREKLRADRRKLVAGLPRGSTGKDYLALAAEHANNAREELEDLLLVVAAMADGPDKARLQQNLRRALALGVKRAGMASIAAQDGMDIAYQIYQPEPKFDDMDDEEAKLRKELLKKKEAAKKKESTEAGSSWKGGYRRVAPYNYKQ